MTSPAVPDFVLPAPALAPPVPAHPGSGAPVPRVQWLDGVRALAALYVVIHHIWLAAYPVAAVNTGPWFLGWLLYGQIAVAVFIVVSGYSLSLGPARGGYALPSGGLRRFLRRRAWRILPPYWAALAVSALIVGLLLGTSTGARVTVKGLVVYAFLLQDAVSSHTPNGAFWSIAVEWQIYFVFPVLLLVARWKGVRTAALACAAIVVFAEVLAGLVPAFSRIENLTPQFLALFAFGMAATSLRGGRRTARVAAAAAGALFMVFVAACVLLGSAVITAHYFEFDLLAGLAVALVFASISAGGLASLRRVLASRALVGLGAFSYSLYLIHTPLLGIVWLYVVHPLHLHAAGTFNVLVLIGLPFVLGGAYAFHRLFERPFVQQRSFAALLRSPAFDAVRLRVIRRRAVAASGSASNVIAAAAVEQRP